MQQKVVCIKKSQCPWLLGLSHTATYLGAQGGADSGLQKDIDLGWRVKHIWEDQHLVTILLENAFS